MQQSLNRCVEITTNMPAAANFRLGMAGWLDPDSLEAVYGIKNQRYLLIAGQEILAREGKWHYPALLKIARYVYLHQLDWEILT
jgi:hypothetical protein